MRLFSMHQKYTARCLKAAPKGLTFCIHASNLHL